MIINSKVSIAQITTIVPVYIASYINAQMSNIEKNISDATLADNMMVIYSSLDKKLKEVNFSASHLDTFSMLDCCRITLLMQMKEKFPDLFITSLIVLVSYADDEEKISIIKGLCFFDDSGVFLELVNDLCRTNSVDLLKAIGIENTYPNNFFSQDNFNQLVLKLLFCQVDISHIIGLANRKNAKLSRMASDYKQERIDANRSLPLNIELII